MIRFDESEYSKSRVGDRTLRIVLSLFGPRAKDMLLCEGDPIVRFNFRRFAEPLEIRRYTFCGRYVPVRVAADESVQTEVEEVYAIFVPG